MSAGAIDRAGFTEVLLTGIETRWMTVRVRPMASGAKPCGARRSVVPRMTSTKTAVRDGLGHEVGGQAVALGRLGAVPVGGEAGRGVEARAARRHGVQHRGPATPPTSWATT